MILKFFIFVMILQNFPLPAFGEGHGDAKPKKVVVATETSRGEWEKGVFTPGKPEFRYRFEIDEEQATAQLTEMTRLKNDTVIDQPVQYIVVASDEGTDFNAFVISEDRRNQRILTLIGKPGALATEVILLGENFFEYCKAASGRLYVSTGAVKRPVSVEDDSVRQLRDALEKRQRGR